MSFLRRTPLILAGLALAAAFIVAVVPAHARPLVAFPPPGVEKVNCGTVVSSTEWSGDDGCEGPRLDRFGAVVGALLLAFFSGAVGIGILVFDHRRAR